MFLTLVPLLALGQVQLDATVDQVRPQQNILAYDISVSVPDIGSSIVATAEVEYEVVSGSGPLILDFDSAFLIDSIVGQDGRRYTATVSASLLSIPHWGNRGDTLSVSVFYRGSPVNGLFIQNNVHGNRTAFADNWPDRAHYWFPSEDHPADKAFATFSVEVPSGWSAIANGELISTERLDSGRSIWNWQTKRQISSYNMVIGAGRMAITQMGMVEGAPQSVWMFPEDSAAAVDGPFKRVTDIAARYTELVGPFPFAKLAHVESSTRFGGMENASAIFYSEGGISSGRMSEGTVAHEIAHQWFGDAVTEQDWHHLWLSEGFASYFGPLYYELVGEDETFKAAMVNARQTYMASDDINRPVIDVEQDSLFLLLNRNNYQKGAWVLRMLRQEIGDQAFFDGVREYYQTFRDSVALSSDLQAIMEDHAGRGLEVFFRQWLLQPGYPKLEVSWDETDGEVTVVVAQVQPQAWGLFDFELSFDMVSSGRRSRHSMRVDAQMVRASFDISSTVESVDWDPDDMLIVEVVEN